MVGDDKWITDQLSSLLNVKVEIQKGMDEETTLE